MGHRKIMPNPKKESYKSWVFSSIILLYFSTLGSFGSISPRFQVEHLINFELEQDASNLQIKKLGLKRTNKISYSKASWYGEPFHGRKTASNEAFDKNLLTCAHKKLAINTLILVTNLENKKEVIVRVNDRGPFIKGRDLDLSEAAAQLLESKSKGVVAISYEILTQA